MKLILTILLFLSLSSSAQYRLRMIAQDDGGVNDTLYLKDNTDSLFRRVNSVYVFSEREKVKRFPAYWQLQGAPQGGTVDWVDITNKPSTYSPSTHPHDWNGSDITNKPTIPTNTNQLTNGSGFLTASDYETLLAYYARQYRTNKRFDYFNEFINTFTTSSPGNDVQATNSGTAAATSAQATDATNRIGLVRSTTGSTATGRTAVSTTGSAIRLGGGTWVYETSVNIATLSNGTERFQLAIGFIDTYTAANQVDGVYFLYDEGGVSTGSTAATYWQTVTTSNSVRTFNTSLTQTTVNAATWVKLRIEVNAAANSVGFYINDALVSTHTGDIPTGSGRETGFGWLLIKSIGTTARTVDFDFVSIQSNFTSDI